MTTGAFFVGLVTAILAALGATFGVLVSFPVDDDNTDSSIKFFARRWSGALLGGFWGGASGAFLSRSVQTNAVTHALRDNGPALAVLIGVTLIGFAANWAAQRSDGGFLLLIGRLLGVVAMVALVTYILFLVPTLKIFDIPPVRGDGVELFCMSFSGWAGIVASLFVFKFIRFSFARFFLCLLAGQIVGGLFTALFFHHDILSALKVSTWAVAGTLCLTFLFGLCGALAAIPVVVVLAGATSAIPELAIPPTLSERDKSPLANLAEEASRPGRPEAVGLFKITQSYAYISRDMGPSEAVIMVFTFCIAAGLLCGFLFGPALGEKVVAAFGGGR